MVAREPADELARLDDLLGVEARGRLIEDEHVRVVDDGLCQPDPLAIPLRQLRAVAVGDVVDRFGDPVGLLFGTQLAVAVTTAGLDTVDRLGQLKMAEDASIDFYAFLRSSYYQTRRAELREAVGLPNVIDSPATALDETAKPESGTSAMASAPTPRSGAANSAPRSSTKKTARANQEATRALASTEK